MHGPYSTTIRNTTSCKGSPIFPSQMTSTTVPNTSAQDSRPSPPTLPIPAPTPILATMYYLRLDEGEDGITYIHNDEEFTPDRFHTNESFVPDRFIPSPGPPTSPRWIPDSPTPLSTPASPEPDFTPIVPPHSPVPSHRTLSRTPIIPPGPINLNFASGSSQDIPH